MELIEHMNGDARVWIYQSDRIFEGEEAEEIKQAVTDFASGWVSHGSVMNAVGAVLHNRFVLLAVDEKLVSAGGCSIDASVHFIQSLSDRYQADFFNRYLFSCLRDGEVTTYSLDELRYGLNSGEIKPDDLFFDVLVKDLKSFRSNWLVPLKDSWIYRMV